ncbi:MAG: hypothetical protein EPO28_19145 [Saprospiraceae bacterium]|nr:MAG: hypothetical protein EPO28_19145 [Saprospiraceae bacterium]
MKLQLRDQLEPDVMRGVTAAVLRADVGSRVNFDRAARIVRIENWLTVDETVDAIAREGYVVAAIVDASNATSGFHSAR